MTPSVSQVTTLTSSFAEDTQNYPAFGCQSIEVWLTKLEQHLVGSCADDSRKALADRGVGLVAAAYQGGLLPAQDVEREAHFDQFMRRLDLCQTFGIPTLVVASDFAGARLRSCWAAVISLARAGQMAAGFGIRLALEFRGADSLCTNLDTALMLVEQSREPNVGVCLDLFHFYKGPSKPEDLDRLTAANLFHVQVCDVAGVPRELMTDADRVMPGDGDFLFAPVIERLRHWLWGRGVAGIDESRTLARNPKQVVEVGIAALQRVIAGE